MCRTIINGKNGQQITTTCSDAEAVTKFAANVGPDNWLWFWIHKTINEMAEKPKAGNAMQTIQYMFLFAIGMGLKRPRLNVTYENYRYTFYLSRRGTLCIKAAHRRSDDLRVSDGQKKDEWNERDYIGCIRDGLLIENRDSPMNAEQREFMAKLEGDTVAFLAECSRNVGQCCYCGIELKDDRSKTVGYGKVCAKNWGLPWGSDVDPDKAPSFARLSGTTDVQGFMAEIQKAPFEQVNWEVLSDYLEDNGLPRLSVPSIGTTIPGYDAGSSVGYRGQRRW